MSVSDFERTRHLAQGWMRIGQPDKAIQCCRLAIQERPQEQGLHRFLLDLLLRLGRASEGLQPCEKLLEWHPTERALQLTHKTCLQAWEEHQQPDQPGGKICLFGQKRFPSQRSGWAYALAGLRPLHQRNGLKFDGFLENNFAWRYPHEGVRPAAELERLRRFGWFERDASSEELGLVPYRQPWIGFWHNPPAMPSGFHDVATPQAILQRRVWQESAPHCLGLFTLSEYLADWLRQQTGLPVTSLVHPSDPPARVFDPAAFLANPRPKIIQVGWWLRRLSSIYRLPVYHHYRKVWLITLPFQHARSHFLKLMAMEGGCPECPNTEEIEQLSNDEYDEWLAENIAFIDLYDSSANCAVVECIARATPLLVNPLPAVREYLGLDYPFYFDSLAQAAEKAMDLELVCRTHLYLKALPLRDRLDSAAFCQEMQNSSIYQGLP